jgi:hypothetical protein
MRPAPLADILGNRPGVVCDFDGSLSAAGMIEIRQGAEVRGRFLLFVHAEAPRTASNASRSEDTRSSSRMASFGFRES